jgi:hypothetical protein
MTLRHNNSPTNLALTVMPKNWAEARSMFATPAA